MPAYFLRLHPNPISAPAEDSADSIRYAAKLSTFSQKIARYLSLVSRVVGS
jgi:hypothetical protein